MGIRSKGLHFSSKFHFVFYVVSEVTAWKSNGNGMFSVMNRERTDRIFSSTTCLERWRLSPSFGPMCILPGWLGTKRERPNLKAGRRVGFSRWNSCSFPMSWISGQWAGTHTPHSQGSWQGPLSTFSVSDCSASDGPLHPTPGWDPPLSQFHSKLNYCLPGCFISHPELKQIHSSRKAMNKFTPELHTSSCNKGFLRSCYY